MAITITLPNETINVSDEQLARYDVNAPRYTSYPTSPHWDDEFGDADYKNVLASSNASARPLSLYMHLPFCQSLCLFCGCNVLVRPHHESTAGYLPLLKSEITRTAGLLDASRPVVQFHWGGGTPTYFTPEQLTDLFTHTRKHLTIAPDAEIGVELDPRVTTTDHLDALHALGFNRLSLGVQDFNPDVQRVIKRIQPLEQVTELVRACRARGFTSLNFDLIYGLPLQTAESFAKTLDQVIQLAPERIALFSYGHVPWVKRQQQALEGQIPLGGDKFALFCLGLEKLTDAGYVYIGMDHFAKPDDELCVAQKDGSLHRNFQGYTTKSGADLIAMGITGISELDRTYAQNFRGLDDYTAALDTGRLPVLRGIGLTDEDVLRRGVISRLLCYGAADVDEQHFRDELARLAPLADDGLLEIDHGKIKATTLGRLFIRVIAMVFDQYLKPDGTRHSRTV